jgi:zinc transport system permease protein
MTELLSYEFIRYALYSGVLASLLCGLLGTFLVVRRLVFFSGGISHSAFGGLGLFYYLGLSPLLGGIISALISAGLLSTIPESRRYSTDAFIGVLWATGMAIGIIFVSLTPGYAPNLLGYLFGNILTVRGLDIILLALLTFLNLLFLLLFYKELVAMALDEEFARVQGVPVRRLQTALLLITALAVVLLIQVVGIILVIALFTIPPLIALRLTHDFRRVLFVSVLSSLVMTIGGLLLSFYLNLPSGPCIIVLGTLVLLVVILLNMMLRHKLRGEEVA